MPSQKTLIILAIIILGAALIIAAVYFLFRQPAAPFQPAPTPSSLQTPAVSASNIVYVSQTSYLWPVLGPDGQKIRFYDQNSQSFIETDFLGQSAVRLLSLDLKNVVNLSWSWDRSKAIATLDDRGTKKYQLIDLTSGKTMTYGSRYHSLVFSPSTDKIAYNFFWPEKNINKIEMADPSGENWRDVSKIKVRDLQITWPQTDKLGLASLGSAYAPSALHSLDLTNGNLERIIPDSYGLMILWSPKGDKVLYSSVGADGRGLTLRSADASGATRDLKVPTFADKCAWTPDGENVFCAVNAVLLPNSILPEDYYQNALDFDDQIIKVNLATGEQTAVIDALGPFLDARNLSVDPQGNYLFFANKKDGFFYTVRI